MKTTNPLVIYHGKCPDGFGAALAAWLILGDTAEYRPFLYHMEPPTDAAGRDVYILDFSFDPEVLERLANTAKSLTLLDHHKSAMHKVQAYGMRCAHCQPLLRFDLSKCGARLAWEHFHPGKPLPALFEFIEDRDLWNWKHGDSRAYLTALDALPFDFEVWNKVLNFTEAEQRAFVEKGANMFESFQALCNSVALKALPLNLLGRQGMWVSATSELASNVGNILATQCASFAAVLFVLDPGTVKVSLRGAPGYDTLSIAEAFGGGGHPAASSFHLPLALLPALLDGTLQATHPT